MNYNRIMPNEAPKNGLHTEYHDNGQKLSETNYKDGKLHGATTTWYSNGQLRYREHWINNVPNAGKETSWYENGQKRYEVNHKHEQWHGKFLIWNEHGQEIQNGIFKNDFMITMTETEYTDLNHILSIANFKNGWLDGLQTEYFDNGQKKAEVTYKKALIIGKKTEWDDSGVKQSEVIYDDNDQSDYDQNEYFSMNQNQGKRDPEFISGNIYGWDWYRGDISVTEKRLNANRKTKSIYWHPNGQKAEETNYKRGYLYGKSTRWNENGQIMLEENYFNNDHHGKSTAWHENGQVLEEIYHEMGLKDGEWSYWNDKSKKTDFKKYEMGKLISWIAWDKNGNIKNMDDEIKAENKKPKRRNNYNINNHFESDIPWIDQQSLTDDEKLLGESFWKGIL